MTEELSRRAACRTAGTNNHRLHPTPRGWPARLPHEVSVALWAGGHLYRPRQVRPVRTRTPSPPPHSHRTSFPVWPREHWLSGPCPGFYLPLSHESLGQLWDSRTVTFFPVDKEAEAQRGSALPRDAGLRLPGSGGPRLPRPSSPLLCTAPLRGSGDLCLHPFPTC